ncbi:MAG: DUF6541 family protein [Candidatus Bathyarchaeia archaeon]
MKGWTPNWEKTDTKWIFVGMATSGLVIEVLYFWHALGNSSLVMYFATLCVAGSAFAGSSMGRRTTHLYLIVICSVLYYGIYSLSSHGLSYIQSSDGLFHWENAKLILEQGRVPFGHGIPQGTKAYAYSFYPVAHILLATLASFTSVDLVTVVNLFPLVMVMGPILIYAISRRLLGSERIAAVAATVFIFTPGAYPFPSYRYLALILFLVLFLSILSSGVTGRRAVLISGLLAVSIGLCHGVTAVLTVGMMLFLLVSRARRFPFVFRSTFAETRGFALAGYVLVLILAILWSLTVAYPAFSFSLEESQLWQLWFMSSLFSSGVKSYSYMTGFSPLEVYFDFASLICTLFLALVGFVVYLRSRPNRLLLGLLIYTGLLFVLFQAARGISEIADNLAERMWAFLFIGLSLLVGLAVRGSHNRSHAHHFWKAFQAVGLVILLCFSVTGVNLVKSYYEPESPALLNYGESIIGSVRWYENVSSASAIAIGDSPVRDFALSLNRTVFFHWDLYYNSSRIPTTISDLKSEGVHYVFVDHLMSVVQEEPNWRGVIPTASAGDLATIGGSRSLDRVLDNGVVQILLII